MAHSEKKEAKRGEKAEAKMPPWMAKKTVSVEKKCKKCGKPMGKCKC